jgi:acetylornithine deacetylase/succinyl-diaminopimelate desuccinylase-like protein
MTASAQLRIARLAATPAVHRAFHWLHIHQLQLRRWQLEILRIPAPPFGEQARAAWFLEQFHSLGLANPHIDEAGNALAELPGAPHLGVPGQLAGRGEHLASEMWDPQTPPLILLSAHLDTVFPTEPPIEPIELETRIVAPGACDNAAGLSGLLALAAGMRHAELAPAVPILFAANVGEEGEGDLRGMRHLFTASPYASRIAAAIALEGGGSSAVVTRALASRRFRVTVTGPGGHSWIDAGAANPILVLARALLALESLDLPQDEPRTTLNVGQISGGTSINSIPESATALLDLRSTDSTRLHEAELALRDTLKYWVLDPREPHPPRSDPESPVGGPGSLGRGGRPNPGRSPTLAIETIGDRPSGALPDDAPLLATLRAVDRHLSLRTEPGLGSTDANIPLSRGIPAIAIGAGGLGGGIHTLQEWYDPTGRTAALRRILLTLLDIAHLAANPPESS